MKNTANTTFETIIGIISAKKIGVMMPLTIIAKQKVHKKWISEPMVRINFCKTKYI